MRFDTCAQTYDAYAAPQRAFAARVAQFARGSSARDVLELGAGTGALTRWLCGHAGGISNSDGLLEHKPGVRATDASATMVELGRRAVPEADWFTLDAFRTAIPAAELQISSGLLQWAPDPVEVLKRWLPAVKPGGRMIHAFPCEPCLREWRNLAPESPVTWRDELAWWEVFQQAGIPIRRKELWIERHVFGSAHAMLRALHRSGVTGQPRLGSGRLRRTLRAYDQEHRAPGGVLATWAWMAVECYG